MAEVFVGPDVTGDGVNDADITPAGSFTEINGAIFTDAVNTGSGTGNYNTFLAISDNDGIEEGFNSDDTPPIDATNKDIDHAKTHTVKLSDLVVVTIDGVQYYEVRVDLNESNSDPDAQISLDQFKIYTSSDGTINSTTTLFSQNLVYDMDAGGNKSVLLSDAESSGSGNDDYAVLIPVSEFDGLDPTETYVYFFIQMGAAGDDWETNATFEEWNLQNGATLTGTKFEDLDGDGVKDDGEPPIEGVKIFIDANQNGSFDDGERFTFTDADGNYSFFGVATGQTVWIDEVVPTGATQTTGSHETVIIGDVAPGTVIVVDPIGNFIPHPAIQVVKEASGYGDCADIVGETITYTYTVTNEGNVALENIDLDDDFSDAAPTYVSGDTDTDGELDVDETWTYTAYHVVTQDDIDDNGNYDSDSDGTNDSLRNVATVTGDAVDSAEQVSDDDDAVVEVCQDPAITLEKYVKTDVSGAFADADDPDGSEASLSSTVDFKVVVSNTGNVTLTNVTLSDSVVHTVGGVPGAPVAIDYSDPALSAWLDYNGNDVFDAGEEYTNFDTDGDGVLDDADGNAATVDDFVLAAGDSFTIYYTLTNVAVGQHENTAEVTADAATTGTEVTAEDDANYYVLADEDCVGVRTPGFWQNTKWMTFWDGVSGNEPSQAGSPGFASGELLYGVDSNDDGSVTLADVKGLLVGDYNLNGITDAGEDTIFISYDDAVKLINASSKQLVEGKGTSDGIYMLGRDVVATWLNYLANNEESIGECIGEVDGAVTDPREYLDAAIDWLQQFASNANGPNLSHNLANSYHDGVDQATFQFDARVAPSSTAWQNAYTGEAGTGDDIPVSAAAMHAALDAYNNTGAINGEEFCCDADSEVALAVLSQIYLI